MGLAVQMLPPMDEALRMGGPANHRSCSATARRPEVWWRGSDAASALHVSISWVSVTLAPKCTPPSSTSMRLISGTQAGLTSTG